MSATKEIDVTGGVSLDEYWNVDLLGYFNRNR